MTMKNINLDKYSPFHKTGHTSKGDQRKWEIDGIWYKADYMGYESLAEVLVSRLLKKSSLKYAFVTYDLTKIEYNNSSINACVSQDFRKEGQVLIPLEKLLRYIAPIPGLAGSILLFGITRNVGDGFLGFERWNLLALPQTWYRNLFTTYLGLPEKNFYSTDYFGLFPWLCLFGVGYFLYRLLKERKWLVVLAGPRIRPLEFVGRHSLEIYLIHQPVIYGFLVLFSYS